MTLRLTIAAYEHRHGMDQLLFATEAQADKWREDIADEYWEDAFDEEPRPADRQEMADKYWEMLGDGTWGRNEYFTVQSEPVHIPPWTDEDTTLAHSEGWCLSLRSDDFYEIKSLNFISDFHAQAHCRGHETPTHIKAILLHGTKEP